MDPQLLMPSPASDFNFDSPSTSPYNTAPSSPKILFPKFFNPKSTNPLELCEPIHNHTNEDSDIEEPDMDFAFDFSGQLDRPSISDADELFDCGKIKLKPLEKQPLQPPPPPPATLVPKSYKNMNLDQSQTLVTSHDNRVSVTTTQSTPYFGFTWYNKWNLKNLLLFRSTSEGSAKIKDDESKRYAMVTKGDKDVKNLSFRSVDGGGSVGGSSRRMKRKVSAHEIHYTVNRAVAEEMRRKTSLPYKSGLLGCLRFGHNFQDHSRRR